MKCPTLKRAYGFALLLIVTAIVYAPAIRGTFLWDDDAYISQNKAVQSPDGLRPIWTTLGSTPQYYPLTFTAFWAGHQLWGLRPEGYHLVNILLHAANAALLILLLEALALPGAWIAGFFFALHPVQAESVAWMTELKNVLSGFFYLLTAILLVRRLKGVSQRSGEMILMCACFAAALLSKSVALTLPFSALGVWLAMGKRPTAALVKSLAPLVALSLAAGLFTTYFEHHWVRAQGIPWDFTVIQRLTIAGKAFCIYLSKWVYPIHLSFIYPRWDVMAMGTAGLLWTLAAAVILAASIFGRRWWGRVPGAALVFFGLSVLPALGLTSFYFMRFSFVADHFQYLGGLGIAALAGWTIHSTAYRREVAILVLVLLGGLTFRESGKYRDSLALWSRTLELNPASAMAHHHYGIALTENGDLREATAHLRMAEALDPTFPQTPLALAYLARLAQKRDVALAYYEKSFRLGIDDPEIRKDYEKLVAQ